MDILLTLLLEDIEVEQKSIAEIRIPVATKKALLRMKITANRPKDQLDIVKLKEALKNGKTKKIRVDQNPSSQRKLSDFWRILG